MKKSYIACALAAVVCSVSMANTPATSAGNTLTAQAPPPITANGWTGKCSNWFTCGVNRAVCLVANGKYSEFDWVDLQGNKKHSYTCVTK